MKKPDFSKQGMQEFFLLHTEKVILGVCVVLLGVFFWLGFQKQPYIDKDPTAMISMADSANRYVNGDSWEELSEFRKGRSNAAEIIANRKPVDGSDYAVGAFRGTAAATLAPRTDPAILPAEQLVASVFPATLMIEIESQALINQLPPAPARASTESDQGGFGGILGGGGGRGGGGRDGDLGSYGDDDGDIDGGVFGGGGGRNSGVDARKDDDEEVIPIPELEHARNQVHVVNNATMKAINPVALNVSAVSAKPIVRNIVAVRALVDFKQQTQNFKQAFENAIAYYPDRDRPIYQFLEVQRRQLDNKGEPLDGENGKWTDISEDVSFKIPAFFPNMLQMPQGIYPTAPEVVAPENFDPVITAPIPPVAMFDYRNHVLHPALTSTRKFPDYEKPDTEEKMIETDLDKPEDIFNVEDSLDGNTTPLGGTGTGGRGAGGRGAGGRGAGGRGAEGGGRGAEGGGRGAGGRGAESGGRGGGGRGTGLGGAGSTDPENENYLRRGSETSPYYEALDERIPKEDYRLVRFFDVNAASGRRYEYRVRLWVGDPNNEDPQMQFASTRGVGGTSRGMGGNAGPGGIGGAGLDGGGDDPGLTDGGYGMNPLDGGGAGRGSRPGQGAGEDGDDEEDEPVYQKQTIRPEMLRPEVRIRINGSKEEDDVFFVSTGGESPEAVPVPQPKNKMLNYGRYLRYCRPSPWSGTVKVNVEVSMTDVFAGKSENPRKVKVSETTAFYESEPAVELVTSVLSTDLGTRVPSLNKFYRGDGLDFFAPAYVMHPISRQVLVAKNPKFEGPGTYQYLFKTGSVLVDSIFGEELDLPRTEKKPHFTATEILVMDENGNFHISNSMDDQSEYRNSLFLPDDTKFVGKDRSKRKSSQDLGGDRSGGDIDGGGGGRGGGR